MGEPEVTLDDLFRRIAGDEGAFTAWMRAVEVPLRAKLRSVSSEVDVEAMVQEALLRMWGIAHSGRTLEGPDASFRLARAVVRNVVNEELRRLRRHGGPPADPWPEGDEVEIAGPASEPPDPLLRRIILGCLDKVPGIPAQAIRARIELGHLLSDRGIAVRLQMRTNTLLKNIGRARRFLAQCLEENGVRLGEVWR